MNGFPLTLSAVLACLIAPWVPAYAQESAPESSPADKPKPEEITLTDTQRQQCENIGKELSDQLMKQLSTQLKAALSGGDPAAALTVCQTIAQPLTAAVHGDRDGVDVGRTSLKPRNAKNAPDAVDTKILTEWQRAHDTGQSPTPTVVPTGAHAARYYRPIMIQAVCLNCHGPTESLPPSVLKALEEAYPEDKARGYAEGNLRGAFRVKIDLNHAAEASTREP